MKTYTNCITYHTGIYKPHTIRIDTVLISIVYYDVKETENAILYAIAIDKNGHKYNIYSYDHKTWTGYLAFPENVKEIEGIPNYL